MTSVGGGNKPSKKLNLFSKHRAHRKGDANGLDRSVDMNLVQLHFNSKRANSVLEENFLHPIVVPVVDEIHSANPQETNNRANGKQRKSIFSGTLKKKIGPMEEKGRGKMFNRSSTEVKQCSGDENDLPKESTISIMTCKQAQTANIEPLFDYEEQGEFIMAPTRTNDLSNLHPFEVEARMILQKLGITSDILTRAIDSGPRSDIIGAYRIVIHRLQKQQLLLKQAELHAFEAEQQAVRPKNNRHCAIL